MTQLQKTSKKYRHTRITRINSKVGRDINRSIILNTVRQRQPISRTEISEITNLNKSTVSSIVASLIEEDLLVEAVDRDGAVGRNPVNLSVRQGKHYVGAIFFDSPLTYVAVVDLDGAIKAREEVRVEHRDAETLVSHCLSRLDVLRSSLGAHKFHGIGASVAGIVDAPQSQVIYAANLGWDHVNLGTLIHDLGPAVDMVNVENDAKASALAEHLLGQHRLTSIDIVFLSLGAGIGAGVAVQGRILSGNAHAAGEVGHMTVVDGGEQCPCGNTGCWELYASERAPVQEYLRLTQGTVVAPLPSLTVVEEAARAGNEHARAALQRWAQHIGVGIGNMICMFDPEVVIVGGSITDMWDLVSKDINEAAHGRGVFARQRTAKILPTSLHDLPPLMGAAALSIRRIFADFSISM